MNRIKSLGGQCLTEATTYESRATHCVIVSKAKGTASYTPKVLDRLDRALKPSTYMSIRFRPSAVWPPAATS